jgi:hypothetical protein
VHQSLCVLHARLAQKIHSMLEARCFHDGEFSDTVRGGRIFNKFAQQLKIWLQSKTEGIYV